MHSEEKRGSYRKIRKVHWTPGKKEDRPERTNPSEKVQQSTTKAGTNTRQKTTNKM